MLLKCVQRYAFLLVYYVNCFVMVNSRLASNLKTEEGKLLHKRGSDFQTCLDNFDIHQDKIIRTQDSRAMGAKYLNEHDVGSRDECLRHCCETQSCDVFVFEEKNPGSCYLFECGSPEDFKCKFTKHQNYTSAVLAINRQLTELESQIKFTQHEHELTKLREPTVHSNSSQAHENLTTPPPKVKAIVIPPFPIEATYPSSQQRKGCSQYQFECHVSKECIAIYNACDGIPQCTDGSDEAAELGCPVQSSTIIPPKTVKETVTQSSRRAGAKENFNIERQHDSASDNAQKQWPQHQPFVADLPQSLSNAYPGNPQQTSNQFINSQNLRTNYGREGEGMIGYRQDQQWNGQYLNQGQSQIFTHKGNGLVPQTDRYPVQRPYSLQEGPSRSAAGYNEQIPNDISKFYYENTPYRIFPQNPQVNNWQSGHQSHEGPSPEDVAANHIEPIPNNNILPPDYYYEESYRNRGQPYIQPGYKPQDVHPNYPQKMNPPTLNHGIPAEAPNLNINHGQKEVIPNLPTTQPPTAPSKEQQSIHAKDSHRKVDKLIADEKTKEVVLDGEIDGHNSSPSGAILSLAMGLCITALMVVIVGCRMRVVHRRMRRGGKSNYAHDADFLVNGMYL